MTDVLIKRELLERAALLLKDSIQPPEGCADFDDWTAQGNKVSDELRAILAAPRQPEGEAASILLPALRQYMHNDGSGLLAGYEYERTQLIVAKLREECDTLRQQLAGRDATIERLEAGIPRIQEQSHQMRKLRDKLEGLLLDLWEYTHDPELEQRIEAALAEVKP